MTDYPIDAVVTWVDGDDPVHRAKRMKYESREQEMNAGKSATASHHC